MKKRIILTVVTAVFIYQQGFSQVSINDDGSDPHPSSMLEVKATDKGILIPRMTLIQRDNITSPAAGLLIYVNDDSSFYYYGGFNWLKIQPGNDWIVAGSDIYSANSSNVGIGTSSPASKLEVAANGFTGQLGNTNYAVFGQHTSSGNYGFLGSAFRGVYGTSASNYGVHGNTASGYAVYGNATTTGFAGYFDGKGYFSDDVQFDGNVGIGIASPANALEVNGTISATAFSGDGSGLTNVGDNLGNHTATGNIILSGNWVSGDGGNEGIYVSNSGQVGLGTSSLSENLKLYSIGETWMTIERNAGEHGGVNYKETGYATSHWMFPYFRGWQSDNLIIRDEGYNKDVMTFEKQTGDVGIGTISPDVRLHINGGTDVSSSGGGFLQMGSSTDLNIALDNNEIMARNNGSTSDLILNNDGGNVIICQGGGNVGIGDGSPSEKLVVSGNIHVTGEITTNTKTKYLAIPPGAFECQNNGLDFDQWGYKLTNTDVFNGGHFYAPVYLPQGATVIEVTTHWIDHHATAEGKVWLKRSSQSTGGVSTMATVYSNVNLSTFYTRSTTTITNGTIDNQNYLYFLDLELYNSSDLTFYGARIKYTYTTH